jgi:hypothetical protein
MVAWNRVMRGVLLLFLLGGVVGAAPAPRRRDTEADLLLRIEREQNLIKRAKLEIRLGRVKLFQAIGAFDRENVEECHQLLAAYLERMKGAWATLQSSGRQAWRHDEGFRELEIALREDGRFLEDLKHRVPYQDRAPVEKVVRGVDELRNQVLQALFPPERHRKKSSEPAPGRGSAFSLRMIQR